jgi:hypothetical protein
MDDDASSRGWRDLHARELLGRRLVIMLFSRIAKMADRRPKRTRSDPKAVSGAAPEAVRVKLLGGFSHRKRKTPRP